MAVMTKIVIYGGTSSGKYVLALQLKQDNPILGEPVVIKSPSDMTPFLSSPHSGIGIVHALNVQHIMTKSQCSGFGPVLFVPAPADVEAWGEDLVNDAAVWDWLMGVDVTSSPPCDETEQEGVIEPPAETR
jgi:hypothetical protein